MYLERESMAGTAEHQTASSPSIVPGKSLYSRSYPLVRRHNSFHALEKKRKKKYEEAQLWYHALLTTDIKFTGNTVFASTANLCRSNWESPKTADGKKLV